MEILGMILGFLNSAVSGWEKKNADAFAGAVNAAQLERNAQIADAAGADAVRRGSREASNVRAKATQVVGAQRAALAQNGIDVGSGTAADLAGDARAIAELDAETVKANAAREAWGYARVADNLRYQEEVEIERALGEPSILGGATHERELARSAMRRYAKSGGR